MTRALLLALAILLASCATPQEPASPIETLQKRAWTEPWTDRPFEDWAAKSSGECRHRVLWMLPQLREMGHEPVVMVGYREDHPNTPHMTLAVEGVVLDFDGVWPLEAYLKMWTPIEHYDWRIAYAAYGGKE